jgi:uncharacterized membrane protein YccC
MTVFCDGLQSLNYYLAKYSALWKKALSLFRAYTAELRFCLRVTIAGVLAFAIAQTLNIPLHGLWVVLTAIVVTQVSVGGSVRATIEYVIGTLGGAVYAGLVGLLVPHTTALAQAGVLILTIAPLAFAAALNQNFRVAPFSAVLVLLISGQLGEGPIESAATRLLEVALGGLVAVVVSLLVFRQRAQSLACDAAARVLEQMARVLPAILDGLTRRLDAADNVRLQDEIGASVSSFQDVAAEARHESFVSFMREPGTGPLSRTLLRLRHDIVIIGRAAVEPLPDVFARRLGPLLKKIEKNVSEYFRASATALSRRTVPPPRDAVDAALEDYSSEMQSLRGKGLTIPLSSEELERIFALGFALEQLRGNLVDLERCIREQAGIFVK